MDFRLLQDRLLNEVRARVCNGEITERGLARIAGLSQPHIHNVLKGARALSLPATDRILQRLGMDLADLLDVPRDADAGGYRQVPLLDGYIGPGFPYPNVAGPHCYPFPASDVNRLARPVAARVAPGVNDVPLFSGNAVLLLDRAADGSNLTEEGYFVLELSSGGAIGRLQPGQDVHLWGPGGVWEPGGLPERIGADLIRARIRLVVRHL